MSIDENRRRNVLGFEGQTLAFAGQHGFDIGIEHAQCVIDGAANALAQMHGPQYTALFVYAVADRIVANIREPTAWPPALLPAPRTARLIKEIEEIVEEPLPRLLQPPRPSPIIIAVSFALLIALLVTPWR